MHPNLEEASSLLLTDDDFVFCQALRGALEKRGFTVTVAHSVEQALSLAQDNPPEFAIVDLKMKGASGLALVKALHELNSETRIVVLTGYASITTAVKAIKLGATQYLSKPANTDEIVAAFGHQANTNTNTQIERRTLPLDRLEWEHIQKVLHEQNNNITKAAHILNINRRTLHRKLSKPPTSNSHNE